jgi:hypothetical protein
MKRFTQVLLIVTFIGFCWLAMQAIHETGHVLAACLTGAKVAKVVLYPLTFSRTDLSDNPHPLAVVWGGPLFGSLCPLLIFLLARAVRLAWLYLPRFFVGFCLIANGAYIGAGWFLADEGDPRVMMANGSPIWLLVLFGVLTIPLGLLLWHRQGANFGLGQAGGRVNARAAITSAVLFLAVFTSELLWAAR